jgi:hypothetical protein
MNNIVNDSGHSAHAVVSPASQVGRAGMPWRERFSATLGALRASPRGYGGTPMATLCAQRARGTRAPLNAEIAPQIPASVPRLGRGVQLLSFAGNAVMRSRLRSRPVKRLFAGFRALFFIARNEGSSMATTDNPCIHRIKYNKSKGKHPKRPQYF